MIRFGTWNLFNFHRTHDDRRVEDVAAAIAALDADVLAVQEFYFCDPSRLVANRLLQRLAEAAGMTATMAEGDDRGDVVLEAGRHNFGVGLLWRPDRMQPVPGTLRRYPTEFWHGLVQLRFQPVDAEGELVCGSYHAAPYGRARRNEEAHLLVGRVTRPYPTPAAVIGADWNAVGESATADPDPYAKLPWKSDNVHLCQWETDDEGEPTRWWADRTASRALHAGGLVDATAYLRATGRPTGWAHTTGHHPTDPCPPRRIDGVRLTLPALPALRAHRVVDTRWPGMPAALDGISDHRPVVVDLDPGELLRG